MIIWVLNFGCLALHPNNDRNMPRSRITNSPCPISPLAEIVSTLAPSSCFGSVVGSDREDFGGLVCCRSRKSIEAIVWEERHE